MKNSDYIENKIENFFCEIGLSFKKLSYHRLKDNSIEYYNKGNYKTSAKIDIAADIKEVLPAKMDSKTKNERLNDLFELFNQ